MSGKFVLQLAMSTCRQSARVSDKMEILPLKSKDEPLGRAVLPGLEWDSDTGITSGFGRCYGPPLLLYLYPTESSPRERLYLCIFSCSVIIVFVYL